MKIRTIEDVKALQSAIRKCSRAVWLESAKGDRYDLKSEFSQYIAIGALIGDVDEELELFTADPGDRMIMMEYIQKSCA